MTAPEVTQIKISNHKVGLVGLKKAFEKMADHYSGKPDDVIADELLKRLSTDNYIPEKVQDKYRRAFVGEFRKFLGQPFENESSEGLEIKVLGEGCAVCDSLESDVMAVLTEMNLQADLEHVKDAKEIF